MRLYKVRLVNTVEPVKVEAEDYSTYGSSPTIDFLIYDRREPIPVASFKKEDVVSITSTAIDE